MTAPKHRGEPKVVWRVHYLESERGWGQDYWHTDYEDEAEARRNYEESQPKPGPIPDYYIIAQKIEKIEL
jgi:hypothetical protein